MNREKLEQWAQELLAGRLSPADFVGRLHQHGIADVGEAQVDLDRRRRCGFPEVIFAEGKSVAAIEKICRAQAEHGLADLVAFAQFERVVVAGDGVVAQRELRDRLNQEGQLAPMRLAARLRPPTSAYWVVSLLLRSFCGNHDRHSTHSRSAVEGAMLPAFTGLLDDALTCSLKRSRPTRPSRFRSRGW